MLLKTIARFFVLVFSVMLLTGAAGTVETKKVRRHSKRPASAAARKPARTASVKTRKATVAKSSPSRRRRAVRSFWTEPSYADATAGDSTEGEDSVIRSAAVEALGPYNGTVVVADPSNGRILTVVNQKLALKSGFQPCSTIKLVAALAALSEGIVDRDTMLRLYGRKKMNLTEALAHSNNPYFASLGVKLGYDRVAYYAKLFGLGERAGLNIEGEQPGIFPAAATKEGGMGMMTSFGEGISLTPLELAGLLVAMANGGTLYYLQYPRSEQEVREFIPRVKRHLDIAQWLPEIKPGMQAAVEYGTARRAHYDNNEPILGKTGTCTDNRTHLGWFGSFNEVGRNKLVVVVLLTGGRPVNGPVAAGIAGGVYKNLSGQNYFARSRGLSPYGLVSTQSCCAQ
ncbi:MAG: penicillin-binding transpeptidase domain-containing protein, partial [Acidobacteria bacterium]|nr:penicillin-binding transpeptidase domain-containing protein [Acidobacteriota bacterium]